MTITNQQIVNIHIEDGTTRHDQALEVDGEKVVGSGNEV